jgi:hypothetical protein
MLTKTPKFTVLNPSVQSGQFFSLDRSVTVFCLTLLLATGAYAQSKKLDPAANHDRRRRPEDVVEQAGVRELGKKSSFEQSSRLFLLAENGRRPNVT